MIRIALWKVVTMLVILTSTGVVAINMYFSYMGTQYMHVVQESEEEIYAMRDEIMHTVSSGVPTSMEEIGATVSHLVTVNQTTFSVSHP